MATSDDIRSDLVLVLITVVWGVTFSLTKRALAVFPPLLFLGARFLVASGLLAIVAAPRFRRLSARQYLKASVVGLVYAFGFITQTIGLRFTTASKAAFITGLSVVLVPVLSLLFLRRAPGRTAVVGSAIAFVGMAVLTVEPSSGWLLSPGDLIVLACAIAFTLHIILVAHWAPHFDPVVFAAVQVTVSGLACAALGLALERRPQNVPMEVWGALAFLAVFATAGTTLLQTWAQRHTSPTHTALIFSLEPVFAAVFAFFLLHEVPTVRTVAGGLLILGGILLAELPGFRTIKISG